MVQGVLGVLAAFLHTKCTHSHTYHTITCTVGNYIANVSCSCYLLFPPRTQPVSGGTQRGVVVERLIHICIHTYVYDYDVQDHTVCVRIRYVVMFHCYLCTAQYVYYGEFQWIFTISLYSVLVLWHNLCETGGTITGSSMAALLRVWYSQCRQAVSARISYIDVRVCGWVWRWAWVCFSCTFIWKFVLYYNIIDKFRSR